MTPISDALKGSLPPAPTGIDPAPKSRPVPKPEPRQPDTDSVVKAVAAHIERIAKSGRPQPIVRRFADILPQSVRWLWPGRIALGRLTLVVGMPGCGKSFLTCDLAARVSTGTKWPDGASCDSGDVLLISAEDDPADTMRPRLDACGADVAKVHLFEGVSRTDEGKVIEAMFTLADQRSFEDVLARNPAIRLVVIDPIGSFLGGSTDAHRENEVRSILAPLAKLAEKHNVAVVVVAHRRKSSGTFADDLVLGSRAFTGIARTVWHVFSDPEDRSRRLLLPGKNNLAVEGHGLAFAIGGEPPRIRWEDDPVHMSADDALSLENANNRDRPGPKPKATTQAADWLALELSDMQEHPVKDLRAAADDAGLAWRTVQTASRQMGVKVHRGSFGGGCVWRLPELPASAPTIRANLPEKDEPGANGANGSFLEKTTDPTCHR